VSCPSTRWRAQIARVASRGRLFGGLTHFNDQTYRRNDEIASPQLRSSANGEQMVGVLSREGLAAGRRRRGWISSRFRRPRSRRFAGSWTTASSCSNRTRRPTPRSEAEAGPGEGSEVPAGNRRGDYQVKLRNLIRFLSAGDKAKVTLRFRGREMAHRTWARKLLIGCRPTSPRSRHRRAVPANGRAPDGDGDFAEKEVSRRFGRVPPPARLRPA
jgi:hypothetical protein